MTKEEEENYFYGMEQADDGSYYDDIQLYGMDAFPLQKVKVLKGDVASLDQENAIAAVYMQDDYEKKLITVTGKGGRSGDTQVCKQLEIL